MTIEPRHITILTRNLEIGYPSHRGAEPFIRTAISLSAGKGEIVALVGPNGIGKSTLLQTLAGLRGKLSGDILLENRLMDSYTTRELSRILSFVSTEKVQAPLMTAAELVAYGRFPYTGWLGNLRSADYEKVMDSLEKVGIIHLAGKMINEISDGERQRTMIARALAQDTPVIILDEPTAFLDIRNTHAIFHLLHQLAREEQKTVILSTHDLHIALREMDKLWIMLESETLEGAPEDAVLKGWLAQLFHDEHVGFNPEKGEFFFNKERTGTAVVAGEGLPYSLTVRALERRGYQIMDDGRADIHLTVVRNRETAGLTWQLERNGNHLSFDSIYSLMAEL